MSIPKDGIITPKMVKKAADKPRVLVAASKTSVAKPAAKPRKA